MPLCLVLFQPIQAVAECVGEVIAVVDAEALLKPVKGVLDFELVDAEICLRLDLLQRGVVDGFVAPRSCLSLKGCISIGQP